MPLSYYLWCSLTWFFVIRIGLHLFTLQWLSVGFHFIYGSSIYIVMTRDGISYVFHIHCFAFGWIQSKLPFCAPALDIM